MPFLFIRKIRKKEIRESIRDRCLLVRICTENNFFLFATHQMSKLVLIGNIDPVHWQSGVLRAKGEVKFRGL